MVDMRPFKAGDQRQRAIDRVARANYGVLWADILADLGVTRAQVRTYLRRAEWCAAGRGVFVVCAVPHSWEQDLMIVCRRAPGSAWVAGRAAARLWRLDGFEAEVVEVVTTAKLRPRSSEQHIRVVDSMPVGDLTVLRGLPTTTVLRTLIDIGDVATSDQVELAYECARRRHQTHDDKLRERIEALGTRGRRGAAILARIIAEHAHTAATDSALEVRFVQLNRRFRLPDPERQKVVRDGASSIARLDFIYPGTWRSTAARCMRASGSGRTTCVAATGSRPGATGSCT